MPKQQPDQPGDGFKLIEGRSNSYRHRNTWLRHWRDSDDPLCAVTRKARGVDCGPPVAVVLVQYSSNSFARPDTGRLRSVCALHLPFADGVARLAKDAEAAAHVRLVEAHPEEFAEYFDDEVRRRMAAATEQAMRELTRILNDDMEGTR
ncbi:hypothetical protein [Nonomuraea basaltis]|uniref:hypothetical protein n=1 Tax=Nonomuraea basaltis TaxID=2495887 RepID=UPI00110C4E42|nr:hypothetical protein [Nonomuraea basaltis]TMR99545.1 hypothetical protein EJK15_06960 [Nonomuraea basaltis]